MSSTNIPLESGLGPHGPKEVTRIKERGTIEFWISNIVIILSTVLGVYLAAQAGYRTAVEFETVRADREGFYMRRALLDELKDNLDQADKLTDGVVNKDGWRYHGSADPFKLQSYVWDTMKQQSITFQLPSEVLSGVRRYYDNAASAAQNMAQGQGTAIQAAKALMEETKKVREATVPALEKNIATLRARLSAKNVSVD